VRDVIALCYFDLQQHDIRVRLDLAAGLGTVRVDAILIEQVILNLVHNAVDAMAQGAGGSRDLAIKTWADGDGLHVRVQDTGPGFSPKAREKLFEEFNSTKPEGMGMGLAISQSIIGSHGGELRAEANPEGGARLSFSIPRESRLKTCEARP